MTTVRRTSLSVDLRLVNARSTDEDVRRTDLLVSDMEYGIGLKDASGHLGPGRYGHGGGCGTVPAVNPEKHVVFAMVRNAPVRVRRTPSPAGMHRRLLNGRWGR